MPGSSQFSVHLQISGGDRAQDDYMVGLLAASAWQQLTLEHYSGRFSHQDVLIQRSGPLSYANQSVHAGSLVANA